MGFSSVRKAFAGSASFSLIESLESRRLLSAAVQVQAVESSSAPPDALVATTTPEFTLTGLTQEPFVATTAVIRGRVNASGQGIYSFFGSTVHAYLGEQLLATTTFDSSRGLRDNQFELSVSLPQGGTNELRIAFVPPDAEAPAAETTFAVQTLSQAQDSQRVETRILWDRHGTFIIHAGEGKPLASGWMLIRSSMSSTPRADEFERVPVINGVAQWEGYKSSKYAYRTYVQIYYSGDANYRHRELSRGMHSTFPNPVGGELDVVRSDGTPARFLVRAGDAATIDLKMMRYSGVATGTMKVWHDGKVIASAETADRFDFTIGVLPVGTHTLWVEMNSPHEYWSVEQYGVEPVTIVVSESVPGAVIDGPHVLKSGESGQMKVTLPGITSGTVRFRITGQEVSTEVSVAPDGTAVFELPPLPVGEYVISAELLGDADHPTAQVGRLNVVVLDNSLPSVASPTAEIVAYIDRGGNRLRTTYSVEGEAYLRDLYLPAEHWSLKGLVDVDGDGRDDLVWQNVNTGRVVVWNLNQRANIGRVTILHVGGAWQLSAIQDENSDGTLDYVWQHRTSDKQAVWFTDAKRRITGFEIR